MALWAAEEFGVQLSAEELRARVLRAEGVSSGHQGAGDSSSLERRTRISGLRAEGLGAERLGSEGPSIFEVDDLGAGRVRVEGLKGQRAAKMSGRRIGSSGRLGAWGWMLGSLVLSSLVLDCRGLIVSKRIDLDGRLFLVDQFCFRNGTIQMQVSLACEAEQCEVDLLLCRENDLFDIRHVKTDTCDDNQPASNCVKRRIPPTPHNQLCYVLSPYYQPQSLTLPVPSSHWVIQAIPPELKWQSCDPNSHNMALLDYTFLNGIDHSSCEHSQLPRLYLFLSFLWCGTAIVWVSAWARNREQAVLLHKLISLVPILQAFSMAVSYKFWDDFKTSGFRENWLQILWYLSMSMFSALQFGALMVLAKGWSIVRWDLTLSERRTLLVCVLSLFIATFTFRIQEGLFLFIWGLAYIIILRLIFSNIAYNHQAILTQQSFLGSIDRDDYEYWRLAVIAGIYKSFRVSMALYLILKVLVYIVSWFVYTYETAWVYRTITELIEWGLCVSIGYLFRSRGVPGIEEEDNQNNEQEEVLGRHPDIAVIITPPHSKDKDEIFENNVLIGLHVCAVTANNTTAVEVHAELQPQELESVQVDNVEVSATIGTASDHTTDRDDSNQGDPVPDGEMEVAAANEAVLDSDDDLPTTRIAHGVAVDSIVQPAVGVKGPAIPEGEEYLGIQGRVWPPSRNRRNRF